MITKFVVVKLINLNFVTTCMQLVIAQLVERWTVESKISIGHWFDSGSRDFFFLLRISAISPKRYGFFYKSKNVTFYYDIKPVLNTFSENPIHPQFDYEPGGHSRHAI